MTRQLEPPQHDLSEQMSDVQRIGRGIEAHVDADRSRIEPRCERGCIRGVVDQSTCLQIGEQSWCRHSSMLPCPSDRGGFYCGAMASNDRAESLFDEPDPMHAALSAQADTCRAMGSSMYARLFTDLAADYADNGRTYAILAGRSQRPVHDAIPLRLAGALHRIVLKGLDDRLARHYPSVGGSPGEDYTADVIAHMRDHMDEIDLALTQQVQTNEVGRSVVHLTLMHWLTGRGVTDVDFLEVGASAGLNMNFDRFYACSKRLRMGDPRSAVRLMGDWFTRTPDVPLEAATVHRRRGVDVSPIDVTSPEDEMRLLSFVWPDQRERLARLRAAIDIAKTHRPVIDQESADTWIERQLGRPRERAVVVFHSIVWQYMGSGVQKRFVDALHAAGAEATPDAPLVWARMEPDGPVADVQVDVWDGHSYEPVHHRLARVGYHGHRLDWFDQD